ncbi:hypothetical protein NEOLEDRAFT_1140751 [Neolentinus lepideus HHB14362 ss-1]|uniref:C2H2-type domain-containing protein n=1 Tax=Neolentinus lepideus HHB14362 ss-1 TaxID=1314782 RepID=A0A165P3I1_9AGAM|nr:hypothetical protein NEOLEDRAFT_1140751 [Neolentinus lepideus HHB14362 ss-1]
MDLAKHIDAHFAPRWQCPRRKCGRRFNFANSMRRHLQSKSVDTWKCRLACGDPSTWGQDLEKFCRSRKPYWDGLAFWEPNEWRERYDMRILSEELGQTSHQS